MFCDLVYCTTVQYLNSHVFRVLDYIEHHKRRRGPSERMFSVIIATTSILSLEDALQDATNRMIFWSPMVHAENITNNLQLTTASPCWWSASCEVTVPFITVNPAQPVPDPCVCSCTERASCSRFDITILVCHYSELPVLSILFCFSTSFCRASLVSLLQNTGLSA